MTRENLFIKVGTYTGDGNDNRILTGIGFEPDLVMIKGGSNELVFKIKQMLGDVTGYLGGALGVIADAIQGFSSDGFVLGTHATVNANATVYYYLAVKGHDSQKYFKTGKYVGDGADNRNYTGGLIGFTPNIVLISGNNTQAKTWRSSNMPGDLATILPGTLAAANYIQSLISGGFQLGSHIRINESGTDFYWLALRALTGAVAHGAYTGNGADDRQITGIRFQPDFVLVKNRSASQTGVIRTSDMVGDTSILVSNAGSAANMIQGFTSDGFTVGTHARVNTNAEVYDWIAFKSGNFNAPIERTAI